MRADRGAQGSCSGSHSQGRIGSPGEEFAHRERERRQTVEGDRLAGMDDTWSVIATGGFETVMLEGTRGRIDDGVFGDAGTRIGRQFDILVVGGAAWREHFHEEIRYA